MLFYSYQPLAGDGFDVIAPTVVQMTNEEGRMIQSPAPYRYACSHLNADSWLLHFWRAFARSAEVWLLACTNRMPSLLPMESGPFAGVASFSETG